MDTNEKKRNKEAERMKKRRHDDHLTYWERRRMAMISPKVPVFQVMKDKIKLVI